MKENLIDLLTKIDMSGYTQTTFTKYIDGQTYNGYSIEHTLDKHTLVISICDDGETIILTRRQEYSNIRQPSIKGTQVSTVIVDVIFHKQVSEFLHSDIPANNNREFTVNGLLELLLKEYG